MATKKDLEGLIKPLKDKRDWKAQLSAAVALGRIGGARAVEPLIQALTDEYQTLSGVAGQVLEEIGEPAVEALIRALKDENFLLRRRAVQTPGYS